MKWTAITVTGAGRRVQHTVLCEGRGGRAAIGRRIQGRWPLFSLNDAINCVGTAHKKYKMADERRCWTGLNVKEERTGAFPRCVFNEISTMDPQNGHVCTRLSMPSHCVHVFCSWLEGRLSTEAEGEMEAGTGEGTIYTCAQAEPGEFHETLCDFIQ